MRFRSALDNASGSPRPLPLAGAAPSQALGDIEPARLEDWFRTRYFDARIDVSSSGAQNYTLGRLRTMLGIETGELDTLMFRDSPSLGCEPLRAAVAARYAPGRLERVMVTHGSTEGIFLALSAILRPGDEVVVLRPVYQSLSSVATALGATLKVWELRPEDDFEPDISRLRDLVGPRTRAVLVNFPHNPTGAMPEPAAYQELLSLLESQGCYLLWDAAFGELVYDRAPLSDPGGFVDRCISFGTLSKAFGLPGLRIGWCIAPPDVLAAMVKLRDYVTISTSPLNELIATKVLERADRTLRPLREQAQRNRRVLMDWAADHSGLVFLPTPHGGVSSFPLFPDVPDMTGLCERLLEDDGVLVVPGQCFGHPNRLRIGFGGPTEELRDGLGAVTRAVTEAVVPLRRSR
ncbi:capreomycidine synthase [Embleya sp. NBC_00896]|uniref:capreomycidine synthase n=1 Tax=Embleya sp. NBC_00896 TaxID=2975961 RepID=UPI00386F53A3|nr:capreomycidine synthase [Embleya sp. NBC_00896]